MSFALDGSERAHGCVTAQTLSIYDAFHNLQGTSLPKEIATQLDKMFEHASLESAANIIKSQNRQLCKWQQTLLKHTGQDGQQGRVSAAQTQRQMQEVIHRQEL